MMFDSTHTISELIVRNTDAQNQNQHPQQATA